MSLQGIDGKMWGYTLLCAFQSQVSTFKGVDIWEATRVKGTMNVPASSRRDCHGCTGNLTVLCAVRATVRWRRGGFCVQCYRERLPGFRGVPTLDLSSLQKQPDHRTGRNQVSIDETSVTAAVSSRDSRRLGFYEDRGTAELIFP